MRSEAFHVDVLLQQLLLSHVEAHVEIGSTNDRAVELCRDVALPIPALVVAERQTAGRGRRDNRWWSPEGSLLFSLVVEQPATAPDDRRFTGLLALAAAAGVADAADELLRASIPTDSIAGRVTIKWPNDVMIDGKKAAGILLETPHLANSSPRRLVIGVGLNVNNRSAEVGSLGEAAGRMLDLQQTLLVVLRQVLARVDQAWRNDPALLRRLASRCHLTGRAVEVTLGGDIVAGTCQGIADDGGLKISTHGGLRIIHSGTVTKS